ncbi:hypothetical protein FHR32_007746 [Streptosporangium album]|uniref:Uncharacterized protein n=1 Tax=Streptosporangium album TaxID=47479 RepID=A0A7W7S5J0_9ACTN|nr:hypothetical protein [Streptosporangium album]MBB4943346.1 hypothetical protein [Streptosporangium album]
MAERKQEEVAAGPVRAIVLLQLDREIDGGVAVEAESVRDAAGGVQKVVLLGAAYQEVSSPVVSRAAGQVSETGLPRRTTTVCPSGGVTTPEESHRETPPHVPHAVVGAYPAEGVVGKLLRATAMALIILYRSAEIADCFAEGVHNLVAQGKPVAITEFGAAGYQGAGERGALGLEIVEYDKDTRAPVRLKGEYARDEAGQAAYLRELLEAFEAGGIDGTFVFTFALYDHLHRPGGDPREDLDLASYGIVKVYGGRPGATYPDMPWEPKAAFAALADYYREH